MKSVRMRQKTIGIAVVVAILLGRVAAAQAEEIVLANDGWQLHGVWEPVASVSPAVLLLHDAAGDRGDLKSLAELSNALHMHALRLELRGHGASDNLGRFEPPYAEHQHINQNAWRDIVAGIRWLRARPDVTAVAVVGASYSGEQTGLSLREGNALADAYVMLSPGNFSDESMAAVDASGVPWLFLRTEQESPGSLQWVDEVFTALPAESSNAEIRVYAGSGHAAKMLDGRPEQAREIVEWLGDALALN